MESNKDQIQDLINKIQVLDFAANELNNTHKDFSPECEGLFKKASAHKLKLIDELLRLSNVKDLVIVPATVGLTGEGK